MCVCVSMYVCVCVRASILEGKGNLQVKSWQRWLGLHAYWQLYGLCALESEGKMEENWRVSQTHAGKTAGPCYQKQSGTLTSTPTACQRRMRTNLTVCVCVCVWAYSACRKYSHPLTFSTFCCVTAWIKNGINWDVVSLTYTQYSLIWIMFLETFTN
jgi:hypothetical protein